uniref:BPTI/Kunitz inhibitor domain-containing protein n=1 Tax=Serinus canaria TaxID=9135 RepID=A0A8C9U5T2_SERCA
QRQDGILPFCWLCRAKELRFFYNFSTGRCRPFSYSGCGGNENNFISRKSCLRTCKKGMGSATAPGYGSEVNIVQVKTFSRHFW